MKQNLLRLLYSKYYTIKAKFVIFSKKKQIISQVTEYYQDFNIRKRERVTLLYNTLTCCVYHGNTTLCTLEIITIFCKTRYRVHDYHWLFALHFKTLFLFIIKHISIFSNNQIFIDIHYYISCFMLMGNAIIFGKPSFHKYGERAYQIV